MELASASAVDWRRLKTPNCPLATKATSSAVIESPTSTSAMRVSSSENPRSELRSVMARKRYCKPRAPPKFLDLHRCEAVAGSFARLLFAVPLLFAVRAPATPPDPGTGCGIRVDAACHGRYDPRSARMSLRGWRNWQTRRP